MHYLLVDETGHGRHLHPAFRRLMDYAEFIHSDSAHVDLQVENCYSNLAHALWSNPMVYG